MFMTTTWIVAADESRARVLQVTDREQRLTEVESLLNPSGRLQDREIESDARDRFPGGNAWEPRVSAVEHRNELFAKRVGDYLDHARQERRYDQLVLVAPPKFLGALRKELHKEVEKLVADELPKDLSWLSARDLQQHLGDFAKGSGRAP
jgi:protein required for attachment to host cells